MRQKQIRIINGMLIQMREGKPLRFGITYGVTNTQYISPPYTPHISSKNFSTYL